LFSFSRRPPQQHGVGLSNGIAPTRLENRNML
jgi:hypothetical protein